MQYSLTRKIEFSASVIPTERLAVALTAPDDAASLEGSRGANYKVSVTAGGDVNPETGFVVNIKDIDALLREHLHDQFDHRCLNLEIDGLRGKPGTLPVLVQHWWDVLKNNLCPSVRIQRIEAKESAVTWAAYCGEQSMVYFTRKYELNMSHRLHNPAMSADENRRVYGKCNNPRGHGHDYQFEVTIVGEPDGNGWILPPEELDRAVDEEILDRFDGTYLNTDVDDFVSTIPTTENIVRVFWDRLSRRIEDGCDRGRLFRLRLWETPKSAFDYFGTNAVVGGAVFNTD